MQGDKKVGDVCSHNNECATDVCHGKCEGITQKNASFWDTYGVLVVTIAVIIAVALAIFIFERIRKSRDVQPGM